MDLTLVVTNLAGETLLLIDLDALGDMVVSKLDELLAVIGAVKWALEEEDVVFLHSENILDDDLRLVDLQPCSQDESTVQLQRLVQNPLCFVLHTDSVYEQQNAGSLRLSRTKASQMTVADLKMKLIEKGLLLRQYGFFDLSFEGRKLPPHLALSQVLPLGEHQQLDLRLAAPWNNLGLPTNGVMYYYVQAVPGIIAPLPPFAPLPPRVLLPPPAMFPHPFALQGLPFVPALHPVQIAGLAQTLNRNGGEQPQGP